MRSMIALFTLVCLMPSAATVAQEAAPNTEHLNVGIIGVKVTEIVNLRFSSPDYIEARLRVPTEAKPDGISTKTKLPAGIDGIAADARANSLIITGTQEGIAAVRKKIAVLDVQARSVRLEFNVLRFDFDAEGNWDVKVVSSPRMLTLDGIRASMSVAGDSDANSVDLTPHLNPDGTISVDGVLRARGQQSAFRRQMAPRTRAILTGVTDSPSAAIRKSAASGRIPIAKGEPFTVYYLQLISVQEGGRL